MGTHEVNRALARWHDANAPGRLIVPTALVGNDKGDLAGLKNRLESDGHAEKHARVGGPPPNKKVVTRKCDRERKCPAG